MRSDGASILAAARDLEGEIARTLSALIRIRTPSCGEGEGIAYVEARMREIGFDEVRLDAMGNLVGRIGAGPVSIAYDAHIDAVDVTDGPLWAHPPYAGVIEGGWVHGRGACDQKGAIAGLLAAARIMRDRGAAEGCAVYVVISVQEEECEGLCWRHLIEEEGLRPDAVVLTEPSELKVARGQKGKVQMVVETRGVSSHGSAPGLGVNAVYAMAPIVSAIERLHASLRPSPPLGAGSVAVSRIESDAPSLCSVPDGCRIYLDRRLTRGETPESALDEVRGIAAPHGGRVSVQRYEKPGWRGLVRGMDLVYPSWLTPRDSPLVAAGLAAYRDLFDRKGETVVWDFSTNGTATAGIHAIPTIGIGPGDPRGAHLRDERVSLRQCVEAAALYAAIPARFVRGEGR
jgi:putative selenium metabolism hydrolase